MAVGLVMVVVKMKTRSLALALSVAFGMQISDAGAAVVFSDNFDSYGQQLNWEPPAATWMVSSGSVDLIGETSTGTSYDFYPGRGGFVDLNGSTDTPGAIRTTATFGAGSYTLSFDLGGNAVGDVSKTTIVSLGSFSRSLTRAFSDPLQQVSFSFTTSGGSLSFADLAGGFGNVGNILDNVSLSSNVASAAPEPSTWAMMILGFASLGFMGYRNRKIGSTLSA
jgi:hypothetical protein